jgi:autotransporter-associated beta strand protein
MSNLLLTGSSSYIGPTNINGGILRAGISGTLTAFTYFGVNYNYPINPSGALGNGGGAGNWFAGTAYTGSFSNVTLANAAGVTLDVGTSTAAPNGNVLWIGALQGGGAYGGNVYTGPGDGQNAGSGGWLVLNLQNNTVFSGDIQGYGNLLVISNGYSFSTSLTTLSGHINQEIDPAPSIPSSIPSGGVTVAPGTGGGYNPATKSVI